MSNVLTFQKVEALPLTKTPEQVLVRWRLHPNREDLRDYEFYIDRGNAPEQSTTALHKDIDGAVVTPNLPLPTTANFLQIAGPISALDFYEYRDNTASFWDFYKTQYYQIRCRRISTQEEVASHTFTVEGELDPVGLYIVDEVNFLLEDSVGEPTFAYRRRSSGVQCPNCFDKTQKLRLISQCTVCYGTNWVKGFSDELYTFVDYAPSTNALAIRDWGATQVNEIDALLSNWPPMAPGDVLRELRRQRMWRVTRVLETEKRRVPMLQYMRLIEINTKDVEYKIPYNQDVALALIADFEAARRRREF